MNIEFFRDHCLKKKYVTEEFPFDESTMVFKVMGKVFALTSLNDVPGSCNLKCNPEYAEELREKYSSITPGYHMNKKHWNTVEWDGNVPDQLILELTNHSYDLVASGLSKELKEKMERGKTAAGNRKKKIKRRS